MSENVSVDDYCTLCIGDIATDTSGLRKSPMCGKGNDKNREKYNSSRLVFSHNSPFHKPDFSNSNYLRGR